MNFNDYIATYRSERIFRLCWMATPGTPRVVFGPQGVVKPRGISRVYQSGSQQQGMDQRTPKEGYQPLVQGGAQFVLSWLRLAALGT